MMLDIPGGTLLVGALLHSFKLDSDCWSEQLMTS